MSVSLPESHLDLLMTPVHGVLTTLQADGTPQSSVVWVDTDGEHILISTTLERQKGRNMVRDPKATLLVIDPRDTSRWIEVRGRVVAINTDGAEAYVDKLTRRYTRKLHFYGDIYPAERREQETRAIVIIQPLNVAVDAIFR